MHTWFRLVVSRRWVWFCVMRGLVSRSMLGRNVLADLSLVLDVSMVLLVLVDKVVDDLGAAVREEDAVLTWQKEEQARL